MPPLLDRASEWEAHKYAIADIYWNDWKELPEVMGVMKARHGFMATKKQYKKQFKMWGFEKNIKTHEMIAMLQIQKRRLELENKMTRFTRRGREVPPDKLSRFKKRRKTDLDESDRLPNERATTPPDIVYSTPEPESLGNPLSTTSDKPRDASEHMGSEDQREDSTVLLEAVSEELPILDSHSLHQTYEPQTWSGITNPFGYPQLSSGQDAGSFEGLPSTGLTPSNPQSDVQPGYAHVESPFDWFIPTHGMLLPPRNPGDQGLGSANDHWTFGYCEEDVRPPEAAYSQALASATQGDDYRCSVEPSAGQNATWSSGGESLHTVSRIIQDLPSLPPSLPIVDGAGGAQVDQISIRPSGGESANASLSSHTTDNYDTGKNFRPIRDYSRLHCATIKGDLNLARTLLEHGENPSQVSLGGITPLHCAVFQRNINVTNLLRDHGANLDPMTDRGQSILFFAVCGQKRLHGENKSSSAMDIFGRIAFCQTDDNAIETINALFDRPLGWARLLRSLDQADKEGVTPLMAAAEEGYFRTVTMFLQRGARPDKKDYAGHTALKYAASCGRRDLVRLLLEADTRVQALDVSHMLKLVTKNLPARDDVNGLQGMRGCQGYPPGLWGPTQCHGTSTLIMLREVVHVFQELGVLERVVELAKQRGRTDVVGDLTNAAKVEGIFSIGLP